MNFWPIDKVHEATEYFDVESPDTCTTDILREDRSVVPRREHIIKAWIFYQVEPDHLVDKEEDLGILQNMYLHRLNTTPHLRSFTKRNV